MNANTATRCITVKKLLENSYLADSATLPSRRQSTSDMLVKGLPVTLTWLDAAAVADIDVADIWGVGVVPFTDNGDVVTVRLQRGIEIPAGGVEPSDADLEATARREAWEEARITLGRLELAQVARVDRRDIDAPAQYLVFFTGAVRSMPAFEQCHESFERLVVSCEDFAGKDGFGPYSTAADRKRMIEDAKAAMRRAGSVTVAA
ncbi:NUDIX hydrolase [Kutzneria sp. NPDC052558]|uniref:NUDIX hydrolase n=1 Tax=Kutzneria sp. NPDC052558 TaxID=3364121 RepID=UPI0037CA926F